MQTITGSFRFQRQDDKVEDDEHQDDGKTSCNLDSRHAEAQPKHPVIFQELDFTGSFTLKGFRMTAKRHAILILVMLRRSRSIQLFFKN